MFPAISLEIFVLCAGFLLLLVESFWKESDKRPIASAGIFVLILTLIGTFLCQSAPAQFDSGSYWNFYSVDAYSLFFKRICIVATICVVAMASDLSGTISKYLPSSVPGAGLAEFYTIPLLTCAGMMFMVSAKDFISAFVALELVTISFYVLVAFTRANAASLEAGTKYLILGALSTGFTVYGITWIFGLTGETKFDAVAAKLANFQSSETATLFAFFLILVGLGFKVGAVPFQSWIPDVYQGAPNPVTAFLSVGSKSAGFILMVRVVDIFLRAPSVSSKVLCAISVMAAATLLVGNLAALSQDNFKRLLAYSSIGHAGYLLMALASSKGGSTALGNAPSCIAFYLFGYMLMTLLSFLVLGIVSANSKGDALEDFKGLSKRSPFLATALLLGMASLAGIPFTVGFYGKFLVFVQAVHAHQYTLLGIGIVAVAAGFYFYLRVVAAMWWDEPSTTAQISVPPLSKFAISLLSVSIIVFGVYPKPVLSMLAPFANLVSR